MASNTSPARSAVRALGAIVTSAITLATITAPLSAQAAGEEIQVFVDDIQEKGKWGYQMHASYVMSGPNMPTYPGGRVSERTLRLMPEMTYGLGNGFETALHFPLARSPGNSFFQSDGFKIRLKYVPTTLGDEGLFYGANLEYAKLARRLNEEREIIELKGILGWQKGPWLLATNLNLGKGLGSGGEHDVTSSLKIGYKINEDLMIGMERYDDLSLKRARSVEKVDYLIVDWETNGWIVNFGYGQGRGKESDRRLVKAVIGLPF